MPQDNRPAFLLYKSFYSPVKHLKDDELGLLFRTLFEYQDGLEIKNLPPEIGMAFAFFKNQFDLDDQKYKVVLDRNKSNGSKGGRPKKEETQANPENPVGFYEPRKGEKEKGKENGIEKEIETDKGATTTKEGKEGEQIKRIEEEKKLLIENQFESFWQSYKAIHTGKGVKKEANQAFLKALKKSSFEEIELGLKNYMADCHSKNIYTKQVSVWLNKECWKSEYTQSNQQPAQSIQSQSYYDSIIKGGK